MFLNTLNPEKEQINKVENGNQDETQNIDPITSTKLINIPAGEEFIQNGEDTTFMMKERFNSRLITEFNMKWNFNEFKIKVKNSLKNINDNEPLPLHDQLKNIYNIYKNDSLLFYQIKTLLDGCDIIHDVNKYSDYIKGLLTVGEFLKIDTKELKEKLEECFTKGGDNVNQEKTRHVRGDGIIQLQNDLQSKNNILLPNIETIILGQRDGYFELIKHVYSIPIKENDTAPKFVYNESGRELNIKDLKTYYNNLDQDEKIEFITDCVNYCDLDNSYKQIIEQLLISSNPTPDIHVDLKPITSFDGCGSAGQIDDDEIQKCEFKNVFGLFNYTVYTAFNKSETAKGGKYNHLVVVTTDISSTIPSNDPIAIFGFWGNITINMLLNQLNIVKTRPGEGKKGNLKS
jgi:hypothetical protein